MRKQWTNEEIQNIYTLSTQGKTLQEIGDIFNVSRERIRQIIKQYFPDLVKELRGIHLRVAKQREEYLKNLRLLLGRSTWKHPNDLSEAMARAFTRKKQNAKRSKWEWKVLPSDIEFSLICPILGIELDWFSDFRQENSPSFDRIDSTKGYIPGNVIVCSWRANRIKNDGTAEEHKKIYVYLEKYETQNQYSVK